MIIYIFLILTTKLVSDAQPIYTDVAQFKCGGDGKSETSCLVPKAKKSDYIYLETSRSSRRSQKLCGKGSFGLKVISDQVYLTVSKGCAGKFKIVKAECGVGDDSSQGFKIISGSHAASCRQFPWMASISSPVVLSKCGGSIINRNHILTAAHCVTRSANSLPSLSSLLITIGSTGYLRGKRVTVKKLFVHEQYNNLSISKQYAHDIAVLRLTEDLNFDECQRPICLAKCSNRLKDPRITNNCRGSGWGSTLKSIFPTDLSWVNMKILSDDSCRLNYTEHYVPHSTICARPPDNTRGGHCGGDSGGPLICKWGKKWQEFGVVSFTSPPCGTYPDGFIGVPFYYDWIMSKINSP